MANVLIGATGSVAAIKVPALATILHSGGHAVKVVATDPAMYFFDAADLPTGTLARNSDEWPGERYTRGDMVQHIELRRWADVMLVAPLDANTLAKFALGLADNFLTCVWRCWDFKKPCLIAPAMNTLMWHKPATARHLRQIAEDSGIRVPQDNDPDVIVAAINAAHAPLSVLGPISKELACGDTGIGGMSEVKEIVKAVADRLPKTA